MSVIHIFITQLLFKDELSNIKYMISDAVQGFKVFLQAADTLRSISYRQFEDQERHCRTDPRWNHDFIFVGSRQQRYRGGYR